MDLQFKGNPLWIVGAVVLLGLAVYIPVKRAQSQKNQAKIESAIVIERIEKVLKVVSVEAQFSEMLSYNKSMIDLPGFRKKALVQVKGKVLVGYNLDRLDISYDLDKKRIDIKNLPPPEILAIDADAEYFDLEQGIFMKFTKEEMTSISKLSKDLIRQKAVKSGMMETAEEQKREMLEALLLPLAESGWKISIDGRVIDDNKHLKKSL